jgi:hypothetical protein
MVIDELNELERVGKLQKWANQMLVPSNYLRYRLYYLRFIELRLEGIKAMKCYSIIEAENRNKFNKGHDEETIRKGIAIMMRPI